VTLEYATTVVEEVARRCTEVGSGARNIDHILTETLLPEISSELLARMARGQARQKVTVDVRDGAFHYRVE
jgi:type VI secretion system protein VasG